MTGPVKTLIVDLDGTIVECGRHYNRCNQEIAERIARDFGYTVEHARELMDWLDVWAIRGLEGGFTRDRFPRAMAAAYSAASIIATEWVKPSDVTEVYKRADAIFTEEYALFPGAVEALQRYREAGWQLILYTKGDPEVQLYKVRKHGLEALFHAVEITGKKDEANLRALCEKYDVPLGSSAYVGDSVRYDMNPACAVGLYAVCVETHPEDEWHHENIDDDASDARIAYLADLPSVLDPAGDANRPSC